MPLRSLQKFRGFLHIRAPSPEVELKKFQFFRAMPLEIVEIIYWFLSTLDRACLALSCARLYEHYVSYTKDGERLLPSSSSRTDLLRRLQNERWVCCNRCDSLHRRTQWRRLRFGKKCDPKPSRTTFWPWRHTQPSGKVDICPCSTITFHEKQHPVDYFLSQTAKLEYATCLVSNPPYFWHLCDFRHPLAEVYIRTRAWVSLCTNNIVVENEFIFQVTKENVSLEHFRKISFRLTRYETEAWLKDFFGEAGSKFFIGNASSNWYQCHGWDHTGTRPNSFMILLNRNLGGDTRPSKIWKLNCHD